MVLVAGRARLLSRETLLVRLGIGLLSVRAAAHSVRSMRGQGSVVAALAGALACAAAAAAGTVPVAKLDVGVQPFGAVEAKGALWVTLSGEGRLASSTRARTRWSPASRPASARSPLRRVPARSGWRMRARAP